MAICGAWLLRGLVVVGWESGFGLDREAATFEFEEAADRGKGSKGMNSAKKLVRQFQLRMVGAQTTGSIL